jgi:serine phosphatase RsbU (regulator of sigma subunit)
MGRNQSSGGRLRISQGILISLICWGVLSTLHWTGAFSTADLKLLDLRFHLRGERNAADTIAVVEVDDETIGAYGQWPLPRDSYALLLAALTGAGAQVVGVDLLFIGPDARNPQSDLLLATVTGSFPNVCHAASFLSDGPSGTAHAGPSREAREALRRHGIHDASGVRVASTRDVLLPFTELLASSGAIGHVAVAVDRDGVVRRVPLLVRYDGHLYPSLGLRMAGLALGHGSLPRVEPAPGGLTVVWPGGSRLPLRVDDEGATAIDFAGDRGAFPHIYSMIQVLRWFQEDDQERLDEAFGGRTVLIGNTAVGEAATDVGTTPFAVATPLVYVHANVVDAVLGERFLTIPPTSFCLIVLAGVAVLLGWLFASLRLPTAVGAMGGAVGVVALVAYGLFAIWRVDVPATLSLLLPIVGYVAIESYRSGFLERRARERDKELRIAHQVQQKLFPEELPAAGGWEFAGYCLPAREVGGDYYDLFKIDENHIALALGDVSGKGLGPALLMSNVHALVRSYLKRPGAEPAGLVAELNEHLESSTSPGMFITFFLGILDVSTGELRYVNGGHNRGIVTEAGSSEVLYLETGGLVVGAMPGVGFEQGETTLEPGSTLTLFSDGVTEAVNHKGDMFEEERLADVLLSAVGSGAEETLKQVLEGVNRFRGRSELPDDLSVVVVHREEAA